MMVRINRSSMGKSSKAPVRSLLFLFICFTGFSPACAKTPTPTIDFVQFAIVADTSTAPLMKTLVAAYQASHDYVTIQLDLAADTERALDALRRGQISLASVSWLPESEKVEETFWYRSFARDPIVVITHSSNPVAGLTLPQLRSIFQGQTLFWSDLGGPALDLIPVSREDGAGIRFGFESLVIGKHDVTPTAVVLPSNQAVVEYVSRTPGAIGYLSSPWLVSSVNLLAIEDIAPSRDSVEEGRYLLTRPFYLIGGPAPSSGMTKFVEWVTEGEGRQIIKRNYALAP